MINGILLSLLLLPSTIRTEPLLKSFTSCLSQHSNTLAPSEQLINFNRLWTQLDPTTHTLRISALAQVASQSTGYSSQTNFLATLISQTSILNFQSFSNQSALCSSIRTPNSNNNNNSSGCPYGPGEIGLGVQLPLSSQHTDYPFLTLSTQLQLLDTSTPALTLGCIEIDTSPYYPAHLYFKLLRWIPIAILIGYLIVCWSGRIWAGIISESLNREAQAAASLTTHHHPRKSIHTIFLARFTSVWWLVWSGQGLLLSGALLRFSTPGLRDILNFIQFISILGLYSVQWPEFIYPIFTQSAWSTLVFNTTLVRTKLPIADHGPTPNPLNTPTYRPPSQFITQLDNQDSPLYLNRTLPNILLNYDNLQQGIPRWSTTIGISPQDLFGVSISIFFLCCSAVAFLSVLAYLIALLSTFISSKVNPNTNTDSAPNERDSGIFTNPDTDDGLTCSPPTTTRVFHDKSIPTSSDHKQNLLFDSTHNTPSSSSSTPNQQRNWPPISLHFALLQGNLLRLFILFYLPLVIFSSYQLTLINIASRLSFGISVIVIIGTILIPSIQLYRLKKCSSSIESIRNHQGGTGGEELIDNPIRILSLGPIYNTYDHKNVLYMTVKFCSQFTIGVSIGTAQNQPIIMAVILLIVELTETMLTSLWLPWGDGAAMAPLTFIISVSRIVTAVILVVLTPTVAVGSVASGWLGYVVLLILGGVLGILLLVLVVKFIELILRLVAHIPFDETRSTRAGGLRGAWRRWDRSISRSSRHGRAAEITAKRQRRARRKSKQQTRRASIFSALNDQSPAHHHHHHHQQQQQHHQHLDNHSPYGPTPPSLSPGFVTMNDEDGNIMSAMSQGAWVRTPGGSEPMFTNNSNNLARFPVSGGGRIGGSSSLTPPDPYPSSSGPPTSSSSGFAVVRGGRATEKTPYQMHNDGRNSWRPQPRPQQQQQGLGVTSSPLNNHHYHDYPPNSNTRFGHQQSARLGVQNGFFEPNHLNTTTNLFENSGSNNTATPYHHNLSNSSDHDGSINRMNSSNRRRRKGKKNGKKKSSAGAGGIFNFFSSSRDNNKDDDDGSSSSSSESSSSDEDDDWDDESGSEEEEDERSRTGRKKLKGLIGGLDKWRKTKIDPLNHASSSEVPDSHLGNEPIDLHLTGGAGGAGGGFQVLRQPRLKPSPVGSSVSNPAVLDKSTP
ncbi:hypothetical protein MJO28_013696 [Puccinia striiformis f. sp. tritici]|uniref:Uncharacterized protein n=1 Tax=Puccinia striiformis f. sp. tritici TaxID=168172 RepID=A0ACC0DVH4_9BASI|nr:hypothetical protein MJO28_013696 [Puccinia striiformis f. sp. tritici]